MNGAFNATADAASTLHTISTATPVGFLQILVFCLIAGIFAWQYLEHRDRARTKQKRDDLWKHHMELHEANEKSTDQRLDEMSAQIGSIAQSQTESSKEFRKGINEIQISLAKLTTTLEIKLGK